MNWLDLRPWPEMTIRKAVTQAFVIVAVSLVFAIAWNSVSPNRIPWVRRQIPKPLPSENNGVVSPYETGQAQSYNVVDSTKAYQLMLEGNALFLDARMKEDYDKGHITGAQSLPTEQFDIIYPEIAYRLSEYNALIVYCEGAGCELSEELCLILRDMEYENVCLYEGGWPEWKEVGLPQSITAASVD